MVGLQVVRSGKVILDIERLRIDAGEFVNVIGTNGAGKTTLLKVICGLLKPRCGEVIFENKNVYKLWSWQKTNLRKQIGYIPQSAEYNSQLPFTVREVMAMGRASVKPLASRLGREDHELVDRWIETVGLSGQKDQTFRSLSGGEQQKVLIGRAMVQGAKILMLDEPTSNLDFDWKLKISELVRNLHKQMDLTVIMISHEIDSIPFDIGRTVLLDKGKVLGDGASQKILTSPVMGQVYKYKPQFSADGGKYVIDVRGER